MYEVKFDPAIDPIFTLIKRIMVIVRWEKEFHNPNSMFANLSCADVREIARAYIYALKHDPATLKMLRQYLFDEFNMLIDEPEPSQDPSPEELAIEKRLTEIYEHLQ